MEHELQDYAQTLLLRQCDRIRKAKKGSRRPTLDNAMQILAPHVALGDLDKEMCLDAVFNASEDLRLVDGDASVMAAIEEGLQNGASLPVQKLNGNGLAHAVEPAKDEARPEDKRPVLEVIDGWLADTATKAEDFLVNAGVEFYERGGMLMRFYLKEDEAASDGRTTKSAQFIAVDWRHLKDQLSRSINFQKFDNRKKSLRVINPPRDIADTVLARVGEWKFPSLAGVITCPTLKPDGTLLFKEGYDADTQLVLASPPDVPEIIPCKDNAVLALELLTGLLEEFPFSTAADKSVALSALMTPVLRGAIAVAPLHLANAPKAGSGKSFLFDLSAAIATGRICPVMSAPKSPEELEKRLVGALLSGKPIISLDNLSTDLSGDLLCQAVERPYIDVRPLGASTIVPIKSRATIFATGNNVLIRADMVRRTLRCNLDAGLERPELRAFKGNPLKAVLANRGTYVAAVLTIAKSYIDAGRPCRTTPLASFEDWNILVRESLIWLGQEDALLVMDATAEEDPDHIAFASLMEAMKGLLAGYGMTTGELIEEATNNTTGQLYQAIFNVAGERKEINSRRLGWILKKYTNRMVDENYKFVSKADKHKKQQIWGIQRVK